MIHGGDGGVVEQHEWDHLFDGISIPGDLTFVNNDLPDSASFLSIEQLLMNDDDDHHLTIQHDQHLAEDFFSDVFLDSPVEDSSSDKANESPSGKADDSCSDKGSDSSSNSLNDESLIEKGTVSDNVVVEQEENDPVAKKRKRQLRNRDAAVRSRERKKMYVRDLEMKSKYFEAECRRLGMLLQCCIAENHALRLSLHNTKAVDASMTKQESAVLLLESLLLGSLLWFLGIICLFVQPRQLQSTLGALPLDNVDNANRASLDLGKQRSNIFGNSVFQSHMMGKRCKASRSRMKLTSCALEVKSRVMENAPPGIFTPG